jgi:uncharacterized membrane protein YkoI
MMIWMNRFLRTAVLSLAAVCTAGQASPVTLQDAVAKVERDTHGKVLSAETKRNGNRTVYRIKVLTRDGRVQVVEAPADDQAGPAKP